MSRADLNILDLPSIIQNLAQSGRTGILKVRSGDRERSIRFEDGNVRMVIDPENPEFLADALVRCEIIEPEKLQEVIRSRIDETQPLGSQLLALGVVSEEGVDEAYNFYLMEAVCEVFLWENVHCEFIDGEAPKEYVGGDLDRPVSMNANAILMEAVRRVDEKTRIDEVIPCHKDVPIRVKEVEVDEDSMEAEVLLLCNGIRDVEDILDVIKMGRFDALETMKDLVEEETIRFKNLSEIINTAKLVKDKSPNLAPDEKIRKITKLYERAEELGFSSPQVSLWLARAHERAGRKEEAVRRYVQLGRSLVKRNRVKDAVSLLQRAVDLKPENLEVRKHLVQAHLMNGNKADAAKLAVGILDELRDAGKDPEALRYATEMKTALSGNPEVVKRLAQLQRVSGDRIQAIIEFEELAQLYVENQAFQDALWTYRQIIDIDDENIEGHIQLANLLQRMGKLNEALKRYKYLADMLGSSDLKNSINWQFLINVYEKIVGIEKDNLMAREWLADAYMSRDDRSNALSHLHAICGILEDQPKHDSLKQALLHIIDLSPSDFDARKLLAQTHAIRGEGEKAIEQYLKLSELAMTQNDLGVAREALLAGREVNPLEIDIHQGLATYYERVGEEERAAFKHRDVGYLHKVAGDLQKAESSLRRAVELDDRYRIGLLELAEAHRHVDQVDRAEALYREIGEGAVRDGDPGLARRICSLARTHFPNATWPMELQEKMAAEA